MIKKKLIFQSIFLIFLIGLFIGGVSALELNIISPEAKAYSDSNIEFHINGTENLSYCKIITNEGDNVPLNISQTEAYLSISLSDEHYIAEFWCNDTFGNESSSSVNFIIDTTPPQFTNLIPPYTIYTNQSLDYQIHAEDYGVGENAEDYGVGIDCFSVNDITNFQITCGGILTNKTGLSVGEYNISITVNDILGNSNSFVLLINVSQFVVVEEYCGDGTCGGGEDCSNCPGDCNECPDNDDDDNDDSSSSSGGGGSSNTNTVVKDYRKESAENNQTLEEDENSRDGDNETLSDAEIFGEEQESKGFRSFITGFSISDFGSGVKNTLNSATWAKKIFNPTIIIITLITIFIISVMHFKSKQDFPNLTRTHIPTSSHIPTQTQAPTPIKNSNSFHNYSYGSYNNYVKMIVDGKLKVIKNSAEKQDSPVEQTAPLENKIENKIGKEIKKKTLFSKRKHYFVLIGLFIFIIIGGIVIINVRPSFTGNVIGTVSFSIEKKPCFTGCLNLTAYTPTSIDTTPNSEINITVNSNTSGCYYACEYLENPTLIDKNLPGESFNFIVMSFDESISNFLTSAVLKIYYSEKYIIDRNLDESNFRMYYIEEKVDMWWKIIGLSGVNFEENYIISPLDLSKVFNENKNETFCLGEKTTKSENSETYVPSESSELMPTYSLDTEFEIDNSTFESGELSINIKLENSEIEVTSVNLIYIILDKKENEIYRESDYSWVYGEELVSKKFNNLNLEPGKYTLLLRTLYDIDIENYESSIEDEFRQEFEIKKNIKKDKIGKGSEQGAGFEEVISTENELEQEFEEFVITSSVISTTGMAMKDFMSKPKNKYSVLGFSGFIIFLILIMLGKRRRNNYPEQDE